MGSCRLHRGGVVFASPGRWQLASGHGETVKRYHVQIDGSEVSCHDEIASVKSKKQGTRVSVGSANDTVPVDETVRMPQNFINGTEFKCIDVGVDYKSVLALAKALN